MKFLDRFKNKPNSQQPVLSSDAEAIFAQKRNARLTDAYYRIKKRMVIVAYLLVSGLFVALYLISPLSKTPSITIFGNHYLSDIYAKRLVKEQSSDWMILNIAPLIEYNLASLPWIDHATVRIKEDGGLWVSLVENRPLGYYMDEMDQPYVLFTDGSTTPLTSYTTDILSSISLIHDFQADQLRDLAGAFEDVDSTMIESMSEIIRLSTSYDDNMIQILMADGNYFIGSRFSMVTLNRYVDIVNHLSGNGHCIYATDSADVVYTSSCPWEEKPQREPDYFLDCDGNPILDDAGNPIEIQYLTDANGQFIYDNHGNKTIVNPIEMPNCEVETEDQANEADDGSTIETTVNPVTSE